ncbi:hypothetical protein NTE_03509 [Candidatus Nitrososphaera evergladensis SR1]|uniref:Uncharacterized protein n=1 Tax=Candidatus Nitrososphaera evergladensis SR1 TaxID=1459636 RepID=A0A075MY11_9ARCH|nr:hypothetical protein NTE_03509 [Candidatus Nitrososphaera evergladensis SR1]
MIHARKKTNALETFQNKVNSFLICLCTALSATLVVSTDGSLINESFSAVQVPSESSSPPSTSSPLIQNSTRDTTKPFGAIISPAPLDVVPLNVPFIVNGTASDNVEISTVEVRAVNLADTNGTTYALATSSDRYAHWTFTLTIPDETFENITVRITDTSGNMKWMTHRVNITNIAATTLPQQ